MIKNVKGNIWVAHEKGEWIVITTNCNINSNNHAIMGAGIAKQVKNKYPDFPQLLGQKMLEGGNDIVHVFRDLKIMTFPTKYDWRQQSSYFLIKQSAIQLRCLLTNSNIKRMFIVKPGIGCGQLDWNKVYRILEMQFEQIKKKLYVVEYNCERF